MIPIPGVQKKKVAVFGLGASGLAACEALVAAGADVYAWDESAAARAKTDKTRHQASHPKEWPWAELAFLALSPGVPLTHPKPHVMVRKARQEKVAIIGDVELFARALDALEPDARPRVIAVTGTNGKSTTTALIGHVLKEAGRTAHVGGNIGAPILSLPAPSPDAVYVLELSSFQLDLTTSFRADTCVLLNISPDHLDRHGALDSYVAAKKRIFAEARAGDRVILGVDDDIVQGICAELVARGGPEVIPVSAKGALGRGVFALGGKLFHHIDAKTGEAGDISQAETLKGAHNAQNAAAALAAVMGEGVSPSVAVRSMGRFKGLAHRMERLGARGDIVFVNDSKATSAEAAAGALRTYTDVFWIAGGRAKSDGFAALRPLMGGVRRAYLIGEAAETMAGELGDAVDAVQCGDLDTAFARAVGDAEKSGLAAPCVLLSPACASHDQFRSFEERGEEFRALFNAYVVANGEAA